MAALSGKDRSDKPVVKPSGVKRESDGVIVPLIGVQHNAPVGKGPDFDHIDRAGKRKGMAVRPNNPSSRKAGANVRELQRRLWTAAKQSEGRRFHALYDRIYRSDVLWEAWRRVLKNKGAAGVDRLTLAAVQEYGVDRMLRELRDDLQAGSYHPSPVRRVDIPKPDGRTRPLGIPTIRDRVAQQATKLVIEPIFEADFVPCSFGFRPRRSATDALETIRKAFPRGYHFVVEADIRSFFDEIDHERLMSLVEQRISDRRVLKLVRKWLKAGVMDEGRRVELVSGTPQGGVASPLLANIYLHAFDQAWSAHGTGELVRYCDDFVVLCRTRNEAETALSKARNLFAELGLELHPDKTKVVDLREGREGFDFLGCHLRARMSGPLYEKYGICRYYLQRGPSQRSMKRIRAKIKARTGRNRVGARLPDLIAELNPILRGWGGYFRTGNAANRFIEIDRYVQRRLTGLLIKQRGRNLRAGQVQRWTDDWFQEQGLHRLRGTVRYPKAA